MQASIAQSGERQTEDLKVPGSIPGRGTVLLIFSSICQVALKIIVIIRTFYLILTVINIL